ncbi:hypothetical protein DSL72_002408 [Monilinia vaccinii-corymbosi]|uniref:CCHC-type domain-containing protein n=1 Tax=Monilinia vaccinii-corymbosi TaxID=61207 RepID=A0A8A3PCL9_9HELO|nr:hypothetical protein DSL72_002408 [Monilinia vaccinii-corymbosi]
MGPAAEDAADSRSSVAGRKRALHTYSEEGREIVSIDSSSDESAKQPRKRAKQQVAEAPAVASVRVGPDLTSSLLQNGPAEAAPVETNVGRPVVWNQGVQGGLRTSFQSKKPSSSQKQSDPGPNTDEQGSFSSQSSKVNLGRSRNASNNNSIPTRKQLGKLPENELFLAMNAFTQEVSALIDLHGWPIPKGLEQNCIKYIEDGLTFYPTPIKNDQPVGTYSFNGRDLKLQELLDVEGKPIKFEHITYPDIVRGILANNECPKSVFVDRRAKAAFKAYLTYFYNHVPQKEPFVSTLVGTSPPLKDILENPENAPLLRVGSGACSKESVKPKSNEPEKFEKSGKMISQKITQVPQAAAHFIESRSSTAPAITFSKPTQPTLAHAVDHYETNAPSAMINHGLAGKRAPIKQNHSSASNVTTESKGENSMRVAQDRRVVTGANAVQMDNHRLANSTIGSGSGTHLTSDGGSAIKVDAGQVFEALHVIGSSQDQTLEDRAAILRYFPTTDGVALRRCLICGSGGHERAVCPDKMCSSCGSKGDHLTPACPRTIVCGKCRAVGHQTSQCPEKLRVAKEDIKCITCQSPNHHEVKCHLIWRSFFPGIHEIKKVRNISAYCYFCGRSGHFGPECGLHNGKPASGGITWSKSNMEKYLNGTSSNDAAPLGGNDLSIPNRAKKAFSIKGKANDPIELDDSDDEEGFIHPKVNMGPRNGQIQFSQVGGMPSSNQESFQSQGNVRGNPNNRAPSGNRGGCGSGGAGERNKPKQKPGNSPSRGGGRGRGKAYRGRGGGGPPRDRGAPRGHH